MELSSGATRRRGPLPPPSEKARVVREMFDRIAPRYRLMNSLLTAGRDRAWRLELLRAAGIGPGRLVVDAACGTGEIARLAVERGARAVGVDVSAGMLSLAPRERADLLLVRGDALALPVATGAADAVTCGFALRNLVAIEPFLAEAARVLAPGGRLAMLEVGTPAHPLARRLHAIYFERLVPLLGALLADRQAYAYLPRSVAYLPPTLELLAMVRRAGFVDAVSRPLGAGAVQLLSARRREERQRVHAARRGATRAAP